MHKNFYLVHVIYKSFIHKIICEDAEAPLQKNPLKGNKQDIHAAVTSESEFSAELHSGSSADGSDF